MINFYWGWKEVCLLKLCIKLLYLDCDFGTNCHRVSQIPCLILAHFLYKLVEGIFDKRLKYCLFGDHLISIFDCHNYYHLMVNWYYSEKLLLVTLGNDRNNTWKFWADIFESDSVIWYKFPKSSYIWFSYTKKNRIVPFLCCSNAI